MRRGTAVSAAAAVVLTALASFAVATFAPRAARAAEDEEEPASCLSCHAVGASKPGAPEGLRVDPAPYLGSVHRKSCVQCHEDREEVPHPKTKAAAPECANCHEKAVEAFKLTPHGKLPAGAKTTPTCASCHPPHAVLGAREAASSVSKRNLPATCGQCHDGEQSGEPNRVPKTVADYARSVHGVEVLKKGNGKAPGCTNCHDIHAMRPGSDPASKTFKPNVPKLCGTCHADIAAKYGSSVHGVALARGKMDAPACTDCHSEHAIGRPAAEASTVHASHVSATCASCHAAERILRKYGLPADRVQTYRDSYHGLADAGGSLAAANCASCHGYHDVLPSSDPASRISSANLLATCSRCHQGATQGFVEGRVHAAADPVDERAAWWVRAIYLVLIPATVGGMLLHNGVIFAKYVREKLRAQRASAQFVRFTKVEVVQHTGLALSFITLGITGFALTYPNAAWVRALSAIGMSEGVRGWLHRGAAIVFVAVVLLHVVCGIATRHGRYGLRQMLPRVQDLRDAVANVRWHLGRSPERPRFDRFDYTMKIEYWALVWGGLVMVVTGAMLWFEVGVTQWVPRWTVHVAEGVHFYEAVLAVSAIVVWHFFFVIFHPAEYPMSVTWMTGRVTEHEMKEAHPAEYDRLRGSPDYHVPAGPPAASAGPDVSEPPTAGAAGGPSE